MRRLFFLLLRMTILFMTGCHKEPQTVEPTKITTINTVEAVQGGFITTFTVSDHEIHIYQPEDIMHGDIINYGYSAPLLLVFGDEKLDPQKAADFICSKGIDKTAQENGGFAVYVNPETTWDKEPYGIYEIIMAKTSVAQTGFSHGMLYDGKQREYWIFASPGQTVVYGYGKGADYIAENYLKETSGTSSLSSLGIDDTTMTAAVLENLSCKPVINNRNIIIVSVNNDDSIDKTASRQSDNYHVSNDSYDKIFDQYIDGYRRSGGRIVESFSRKKEGLKMTPYVFEVNTSEDNHSVHTSWYKVGAVVFAKEDSKPRPLVLCFHGGGDTAILTSTIAGWDQIACQENFILCAIEMHTKVTATEVMQVVEQLKGIYNIDTTRMYATGFSMGGVKTWDLYQEYPEFFAALAPMGATTEPGKNTQFYDSPVLNEDVMVPLFYNGGESSQLGELPYQSQTVGNRVMYLFKVNRVEMPFELSVGSRSQWQDSIYGYKGDIVEELTDESHPESVTTIRYYRSDDGNIYTALCSVSRHAHEIRLFTCQKAWEFMKQFRRNADGSISIINN